MKRKIFVPFLAIIVMMITSCAPSKELTNGIPSTLPSFHARRYLNSVEVQKAQRIEDTKRIYSEMDINRLKNQTVKADAAKGYEGKILNLTKWYNIQFNIQRIDERGALIGRPIYSEVLAPGQQVTRHLLPGQYQYSIYINGKLKDVNTFPVNSEMYSIFGETLHWYIYRDDR